MRAPWTLWRHLLFEQWRLIALTATLVVLVISFAAAIKPLADGTLPAADAPRFMLLAIPPMLTYAIPFAAGFGATIGYHRLVQDNEVLAAHAGGISHRSLLAPAVATGLLLTGVLTVLNEQVIPRFLQSMEQMITRDVARMMSRSVETGQALKLGDVVIYADHAWTLGPDAASGAYERIQLTGLAVMGLTRQPDPDAPDGPEPLDVEMELTAERAIVWLFPAVDPEDPTAERGGTDVYVQLTNAVGSNAKDVPMLTGEEGQLGPIYMPGAFNDDPKFLTFAELQTLRDDPDRMSFIESRKRALAQRMADIDAFQAIRTALRETGRVTFRTRDGRPVRVEGRGLRPTPEGLRIVNAEQDTPVAVELFPQGGSGAGFTRYLADTVHLRAEPPLPGTTGTNMTLSLAGVTLETGDPQAPMVSVDDRRITDLVPQGDRSSELSKASSAELLQISAERLESSEADRPALEQARDDLIDRIDNLQREITSKRHERVAMAASVLVMVLGGSIAAMRMRHSPPLLAYLWSFFPALGAIVTISGGQQVVHKSGSVGLILLWGGLAALMLVAGVAYRGLARH